VTRFSGRGLLRAQKLYESATLDEAQRRMVADLASTVAPLLGMAEVACRGFWLQAILKWQRDHETTVDTVSALPPVERLGPAEEIRENFRAAIAEILDDPRDRGRVDEAIDAAFRVYLERWANR
jgi:hypothetical protein